MTAPRKVGVLLLVGAEGDAPPTRVLGTESTPLMRLLDDTGGAVVVRVVSLATSRDFLGAASQIHLDGGDRSILDRVLATLGADAVRKRFDTFPVGRLLNSIGPLAPSRTFWRTLRRHPESLALLRSSDVVIATDLETTKAAWLAVHRGWVDNAFYDHRAVAVALDLPT